MRFVKPDHEHRETDEDRERNVDPEKAVDESRADVPRYSCRTVASTTWRTGLSTHTIVDRTDDDSGETEDNKWDKNSFYGILD